LIVNRCAATAVAPRRRGNMPFHDACPRSSECHKSVIQVSANCCNLRREGEKREDKPGFEAEGRGSNPSGRATSIVRPYQEWKSCSQRRRRATLANGCLMATQLVLSLITPKSPGPPTVANRL